MSNRVHVCSYYQYPYNICRWAQDYPMRWSGKCLGGRQQGFDWGTRRVGRKYLLEIDFETAGSASPTSLAVSSGEVDSRTMGCTVGAVAIISAILCYQLGICVAMSDVPSPRSYLTRDSILWMECKARGPLPVEQQPTTVFILAVSRHVFTWSIQSGQSYWIPLSPNVNTACPASIWFPLSSGCFKVWRSQILCRGMMRVLSEQYHCSGIMA